MGVGGFLNGTGRKGPNKEGHKKLLAQRPNTVSSTIYHIAPLLRELS